MRVIKKKSVFYGSKVEKILNEFGWISDDVLAVGGCVRDLLTENEINDVDIASSVLPQDLMEEAKKRGYAVYDTGVEHGTVSLMSKESGELIEHTTFRKDVSTDGRRATVKFSNSFFDDSKRRDFTMNALGISKVGTIYDYHSGIKDMESGYIQFVGDSKERLEEDNLRALRAFRFASRFHLEIQPDDLYFITETLETTFSEMVSSERVLMEIEKAMKYDDESWYKFVSWISHYMVSQYFGLEMDGHSVKRMLMVPTAFHSYDGFIHTLIYGSGKKELMDELPITIPQSKRLSFAFQLKDASLVDVIWRNKGVLLQTEYLFEDWFIETLSFDLKSVVQTLKGVLDEEWPAELEGREIGEWQKKRLEELL